ncbi:keratin, type I cytoskeletal 19-like [Parambassis ranga]|uniref:Keratin, type I cytoskeletal 19-like n=1 Tax=Parambassis ranga TaxID=210632 RepID=A0A6P7JMV9_9TELE|nr:keratin, type I cytoskeletal 19-like [Parambassis ranga]
MYQDEERDRVTPPGLFSSVHHLTKSSPPLTMSVIQQSLSSSRRISTGFQSRSPSVHGGAGGYGTRISQSNWYSSAGSQGLVGDIGIFGDEKVMMQNLNDRLGSYLDKVRALETENRQLELQISEFCTKKTINYNNYASYFASIADLQAEIGKQTLDNNRILLHTDNARMAALDFKTKYEMELNLRSVAEADVLHLRGNRDTLTLNISDLELQFESIKSELASMKLSHMEEIDQLRNQCGGSVTVDVNAGISVDLNKVLQEMRAQYESRMEKNQKDLEIWFQSKVTDLRPSIEVYEVDKELHGKVSDLRSSYNSLEIQRQSILAKIWCLQQNLQEVSLQYKAQVKHLQLTVTRLEDELQQLNASRTQQKLDYQHLMHIKDRLQEEIDEYRRLLGGESFEQKKAVIISKVTQVEETKPHIEKRVKTIVEEIVDGKVVSSSTDIEVETIQ